MIHVNSTYVNLNNTFIDYKFELCSTLKNIPMLVNIVFELIKGYSNNFIHECPYYPGKRIEVENFPIDSLSLLFSAFNHQIGNYKTFFVIRDKNDMLIFYAIFYVSISRKRSRKTKNN